jgi:hypothetical protein
VREGVELKPAWHVLFAPLPEDAVVQRKPVASPELVAAGKADAIMWAAG